MLEFDNLQMMFAYHYDWVLHLHYTFQEIIMSDNMPTYRVTIDIKTKIPRKALLEWIPAAIWDNLDSENGEDILEVYVDEMRS